MDGFLTEDNGAALYCDACGQQVRSNEYHHCEAVKEDPPANIPEGAALERLVTKAGLWDEVLNE